MESLNSPAIHLLFSKSLYLIQEKIKPLIIFDQAYENQAPERLFIERLVNYLGHGQGFEETTSSEPINLLSERYMNEALVICFTSSVTEISLLRQGFVVCPGASTIHQDVPRKKILQKLIDPYRYQ